MDDDCAWPIISTFLDNGKSDCGKSSGSLPCICSLFIEADLGGRVALYDECLALLGMQVGFLPVLCMYNFSVRQVAVNLEEPSPRIKPQFYKDWMLFECYGETLGLLSRPRRVRSGGLLWTMNVPESRSESKYILAEQSGAVLLWLLVPNVYQIRLRLSVVSRR